MALKEWVESEIDRLRLVVIPRQMADLNATEGAAQAYEKILAKLEEEEAGDSKDEGRGETPQPEESGGSAD